MSIATLKEGAERPTAQLQQLGVKTIDEIGRMLILQVPAESLLALNDMDEIESVGRILLRRLGRIYGR